MRCWVLMAGDFRRILNANSISTTVLLIEIANQNGSALCRTICWLTDLKVLVGQVDLQAEGVDSLGERPGLQLSQREGVLTESG